MPENPPAQTGGSSARNVEKQLKVYQTLALILVLLLAAAGVWCWHAIRASQPVAILLDGTPVTTVRNATDANELLRMAELQKAGAGYNAGSIVRLQQVTLQRSPGVSLDTDDIALQRLVSALHIHVRAYVIVVDDHPTVGLPTLDEASNTLTMIKDHYANLSTEGTLIAGPNLLSNVIIERMAVTPNLLRSSADQAAPPFWTPSSPTYYTVKPGDRGTSIARRHHVSLTDLMIANPDLDLNRIRVGDQVNVSRTPPMLKVSVQRQFSAQEPIMPNTPASKAGLRKVTYIVSYVNGVETRRDATSMVTIQKPTMHYDIL